MIEFTLQGIKRALFNWIVPLVGYDAVAERFRALVTNASGDLCVSPPRLTPGTPALVTSDGEAIASNTSRKAFLLQNLDDAAVYVRLASSNPTTSVFDWVLPACTAANDGTSPPVMIYGYTGSVRILAASGSPRVTKNEYT